MLIGQIHHQKGIKMCFIILLLNSLLVKYYL